MINSLLPLQNRFREVVGEQADAASKISTQSECELRHSNELRAAGLQSFEESITSAVVNLTDNRQLVAWEYEALEQIAQDRGCSLQILLPRVKIEDRIITSINFSGMNLGDQPVLSLLARFGGLLELRMTANHITNVAPFAELSSLEILLLPLNQIADISPLAKLSSLSQLGLDHNLITDIKPLASLTSLTQLGLGDNRIADLAVLGRLNRLELLSIYDNPLSRSSKDWLSKFEEQSGVKVFKEEK